MRARAASSSPSGPAEEPHLAILTTTATLTLSWRNLNQRAYVLRNDGGNRNGWITIQPVGVRSNRDCIGCSVKVVTASGLVQHYAVQTAVGYQSASDKRIHVGLGTDRLARDGGGPVALRGGAQAGERQIRANNQSHGAAAMTRRKLLGALGLSAADAIAQGISSRGVKPQPRGKPSGRPFNARFTDISAQAGLTHPVIYGGLDRKEFILEVVGCGVAFVDYDNDGWMDLFVLSGARLSGTPAGTTNRLYKNNRDGTFTDVTAKAGLTSTGWSSAVTVGDFDNDGFDDIFITRYGQNILYRNNGDGTFTDVTKKAGLEQAVCSLRRRLHLGGLRP